ncbi:MAG: hypoxanthine phosphoribosyltransferase [Floccifex porci]|uniref:Hypoxanthine phosphoribosyltransferase n=1 Tax=Floccifex porci TaxID=2606629 RepID=A0A7X2N1Q1_9FIRM|nr:hypoxanthine phosphoribosyltransferase [Floccifex porci]MCI7802110.1 hypoxanthine phosphoribosyltransferase [Erysipelotrichaceae bacterium]MDD7466564.1 hypoxanthine phosphoribosyltransferase [Floccifex porci]MDO4479439.1 hypoxanthine phosphoribosyltransferase [Erysipelotrichaceae bacterium]MDY4796560.1 hypoxanthine phosphoribosyltransferase [Floccifex porci]MSS00853.1 hypoxanthine phosphoribosyltransferase [Floccifex porci]
MNKDIEKVLISEEEISSRCRLLASELEMNYKDLEEPLLIVGLLKGSVPFMAELMKRFTIPCEIDFMKVSSYVGTKSVGDVKINKDLDHTCDGKCVLIVEDIIDTGKTIKAVKQMFYNKGAKDVKIVALLDKPEGRQVDIEADYVGFTIPNEFVVGYGLDYDQKYRNLPYVGVLSPSVYTK